MERIGKYSSLLKTRILTGLLSLSAKGYFVQTGWLNSYLKKQALATDGSPIPWLTYSFLDFLEERTYQTADIFEFGSGNSTLYFSKKAKSIRSIENNEEWYNYIKKSLPENVSISYVPVENKQYEDSILSEDKQYDIILVDGRNRVNCVKNSISKLKDTGVIILDDSEREKYQEAFNFLKQQGFKHLPFSGIAIGAIHRKCTSVFYKKDNIFAI